MSVPRKQAERNKQQAKSKKEQKQKQQKKQQQAKQRAKSPAKVPLVKKRTKSPAPKRPGNAADRTNATTDRKPANARRLPRRRARPSPPTTSDDDNEVLVPPPSNRPPSVVVPSEPESDPEADAEPNEDAEEADRDPAIVSLYLSAVARRRSVSAEATSAAQRLWVNAELSTSERFRLLVSEARDLREHVRLLNDEYRTLRERARRGKARAGECREKRRLVLEKHRQLVELTCNRREDEEKRWEALKRSWSKRLKARIGGMSRSHEALYQTAGDFGESVTSCRHLFEKTWQVTRPLERSLHKRRQSIGDRLSTLARLQTSADHSWRADVSALVSRLEALVATDESS